MVSKLRIMEKYLKILSVPYILDYIFEEDEERRCWDIYIPSAHLILRKSYKTDNIDLVLNQNIEEIQNIVGCSIISIFPTRQMHIAAHITEIIEYCKNTQEFRWSVGSDKSILKLIDRVTRKSLTK